MCAWTAPRTWTTGEVLTAALLNTHVRDDLLETAPAKVTTQGDLVYATGASALARLAKGTAAQVLRMNSGATAPEWADLRTFYKYKTAQQDLVATTTFANVTATSGNLEFTAKANVAYWAEWSIYVSTDVAGGLKLQLTGPAAPTAVLAFAEGAYTITDAGLLYSAVDKQTAFSSPVWNVAGANDTAGWKHLRALIVNGANQGAVTLQAAQNSASGTTSITSGVMRARTAEVAV